MERPKVKVRIKEISQFSRGKVESGLIWDYKINKVTQQGIEVWYLELSMDLELRIEIGCLNSMFGVIYIELKL